MTAMVDLKYCYLAKNISTKGSELCIFFNKSLYYALMCTMNIMQPSIYLCIQVATYIRVITNKIYWNRFVIDYNLHSGKLIDYTSNMTQFY